MKEQQQTGEPRVRKGFVLGLSAVIVFAIAAVAILRLPRQTEAPVAAAAPEAAAPAASAESPQVAAAAPEAPFPVPKLGELKEKPQVVRAKDSPLSDIKLTFKLDPRLTGSLYMGDRWVCPPTYYKTGSGKECSFEATVEGIDSQGQVIHLQPTIEPADPGMVSVSPGPGKVVTVTVHHPGKTSLEVAALGMSKKLPLNALPYGSTIVVEVYQE